MEEVGQDAGEKASGEKVGEPKKEPGKPGVNRVGKGPPGGGVKEGEDQGLEEEPRGSKPGQEEALQKASEEDLLRHPREEGEEEEDGGSYPGPAQGFSQSPVEVFRFPEGSGEKMSKGFLQSGQGQEEAQGIEKLLGVRLAEGKVQEKHTRSPKEE